MIPDIVTDIFHKIVDFLTTVGSVAQELLILVPFAVIIFLTLAVLNYREELHFNRMSSSRIADIDQLDQKRYYLFMIAFLGWMGYNEEYYPPQKKAKNVGIFDDEDDEIIEEDSTTESEQKPEPLIRPLNPLMLDKNKIKFGEPLVLIKDEIRYGVLPEKKDLGVGTTAFNKLEKVMGENNCQEGIIINNGFYSDVDLEEGLTRNIELHDRDWLIKMLLNVQGFEDTQGKDFSYYFHDFWRWALYG